MKKSSLLLFTLLMAMAVSVAAAKENTNRDAIRDALKEQNEMRQDITWTVEGLYKLGHSRNKKLKLTPAQARKILPIYQELIDKKIVRLETDPGQRRRAGSNQGDLTSEQAKKRLQELTALTKLGRTKLAQINKILTPAQVDFIDNLDFKPEQYGYIDFDKLAVQGGMNSNSGSEQSQRPSLLRQNEANRRKLYKLNRDVLEMLQKMK